MREVTLPETGVAAVPSRASAGFSRTLVVLFSFVTLKAFGNLSLAMGMRRAPAVSTHLGQYIQAMLDPFVASGIVMLILAVLTQMVLYSLADLSFVLPVTAIGYVLATFLGRFFLHETVSVARWAGTLMIFAGAALVGSTSRNTTGKAE